MKYFMMILMVGGFALLSVVSPGFAKLDEVGTTYTYEQKVEGDQIITTTTTTTTTMVVEEPVLEPESDGLLMKESVFGVSDDGENAVKTTAKSMGSAFKQAGKDIGKAFS